MSRIIGKQEHFVSRLWMLLMLLASVGSLLSCSKQEKTTAEKPATEKTFASPADAGAAFLEAAKSGDQGALLAIFGPDAKDVSVLRRSVSNSSGQESPGPVVLRHRGR